MSLNRLDDILCIDHETRNENDKRRQYGIITKLNIPRTCDWNRKRIKNDKGYDKNNKY